MKSILTMLAVLCLSGLAMGEITLVVDPPTDIGGGLMRTTVHLVADSAVDTPIGWSGKIQGTLNQVWINGNTKTPNLDNLDQLTAEQRGKDTHLLLYNDWAPWSWSFKDQTTELSGRLGLQGMARSMDLPMAQIVYQAGTNITITGLAMNDSGKRFDLASPPLAVPFPGDANHDNIVDVGDLGVMGFNYGKRPDRTNPVDMNQDGAVDDCEFIIFAAHSGSIFGSVDGGSGPLHGDVTCDGSVDVGDLGALGGYYGFDSRAKWEEGDFNGDGAVDVGDLGILGSHYGQGPTGTVPEPCTLSLLALASLALTRRRESRRSSD